jgi:hypothetical protein
MSPLGENVNMKKEEFALRCFCCPVATYAIVKLIVFLVFSYLLINSFPFSVV